MAKNKWKSQPLHKGKLYTLYSQANKDQMERGLNWYEDAHTLARALAKLSNVTVEQAAGVIAALSPACPWERNIMEAQALLAGNEDVSFTTYPANVDKAYRIKNGGKPLDILGGKKVRSFYALILNPSDPYSVCVDRHAVECITYREWRSDQEKQSFLRSQYDRAADVFRSLAAELDLLPHQVQAITWTVQRELP